MFLTVPTLLTWARIAAIPLLAAVPPFASRDPGGLWHEILHVDPPPIASLSCTDALSLVDTRTPVRAHATAPTSSAFASRTSARGSGDSSPRRTREASAATSAGTSSTSTTSRPPSMRFLVSAPTVWRTSSVRS